MSRSDDSRPRRPALFGPAALDTFASGTDPQALAEAAHATAAAIVDAGRRSDDPDLTARLVRLVDDHGLDTIADLWADRPARSLPGALWRLYVVREWVRRDADAAARDYRAGCRLAEVSDVVAGVAHPPGPDEVRTLVDAVLTGVYRGELDVALERAAAFCRVVASGRAVRADDVDDEGLAAQVTRRAASLQQTADDLDGAARAWRVSDLT
ncbi:hypothetical protein [Angustibacter sp. Root456]|uniref:hypothetical protein n=1 Tax=Angustibacter sp. Root456 TaxID=1736539 RepID=UPI0006F8EB7A|nr:hypothetical protein [Angustibacter sp. Root456]KQX61614.1 hypothetical protein ASD06_13445 [Angustibacter sp. Root456]